jgi:heme-degrading monooxygenase HmoA
MYMLVRIWKVGLLPEKSAELETFANNISLPMFRAQRGCLAVFFTRTETECATITIWESEQAISEMENSPLYKQVVRQIEQSGILETDHQTQVFHVYGGFIDDKTQGIIAHQ